MVCFDVSSQTYVRSLQLSHQLTREDPLQTQPLTSSRLQQMHRLVLYQTVSLLTIPSLAVPVPLVSPAHAHAVASPPPNTLPSLTWCLCEHCASLALQQPAYLRTDGAHPERQREHDNELLNILPQRLTLWVELTRPLVHTHVLVL